MIAPLFQDGTPDITCPPENILALAHIVIYTPRHALGTDIPPFRPLTRWLFIAVCAVYIQ